MLPVVSLYDYSGDAVRPWAAAGFPCYCFDIKHEGRSVQGGITFIEWDAHRRGSVDFIRQSIKRSRAALVFGFPPCDDLTASGSAAWSNKHQVDPDFRKKALQRVLIVPKVAESLKAVWIVENPVGSLPRVWKPWDYIFNPCQYGGYLNRSEAIHPRWPRYIPDYDAYKKKTCLWTHPDFVMPKAKLVQPEIMQTTGGRRGSRQFVKLGGGHRYAKEIRSSTPRGFAKAVFLANRRRVCER